VSIEAGELCLLIRARRQLYALRLEHVEETMRPLPMRPIAGVPPFVRGIAVVRGLPVPVVDAASVVGSGEPSSCVTRFVSLAMAGRRVALAVDEVLGLRRIDRTQLSQLPPLLADAGEEVLSAIGTLDTELLMVLRSGHLVPEDAWKTIDAGEAS
jgi:purine-binding chemotaxis protein CheW